MIISESKKENYSVEISNQNTVIISDVTEEKGGCGQYFRPHDLLCAGFASCLNITVRMVLDSRNIKYEKVVVQIDLDRSCEGKTKFLYDVNILGDISDDIKQQVIDTACNCPVRRTLSKEIEFEMLK